MIQPSLHETQSKMVHKRISFRQHHGSASYTNRNRKLKQNTFSVTAQSMEGEDRHLVNKRAATSSYLWNCCEGRHWILRYVLNRGTCNSFVLNFRCLIFKISYWNVEMFIIRVKTGAQQLRWQIFQRSTNFHITQHPSNACLKNSQ